MTIPHFDYSSKGDPLVFLHANGYPPECYRPLLERLAGGYRVSAMLQRPLWPESDPQDLQDWRPLSEDLLQYLQERDRSPGYCVGHSMGGIALLRAALIQPERFHAIALLDPVLFPPLTIWIWKAVHALGFGYRFHPLVAAARNRRRQFDDLERLFQGYRRKPVFKYMDDDALRAYVHGIACPRGDGGYKLCYPVEWETRIYTTGLLRDMELWRGLPELSVPMLIIRGAHSNTFRASTARMVSKRQPRARLVALELATHLVPLERPIEVHTLIHSFFKENT